MEPQTSLFENLHKQYQSMVLQMCKGYMKGDKELAEDLAQEIFINVWNALPRFRAESSHKTWIFRITVNTCLLHIRKQKGKTKVPIEEAENLSAETINTGEGENLYKAIGQLEKIDRLIIMMVLEELDYEEIARVMGISMNNLRVKIHRAKQRIKNIMEHEQ
jgi:RNA polymerase sigma factor (sigma-70 family)